MVQAGNLQHLRDTDSKQAHCSYVHCKCLTDNLVTSRLNPLRSTLHQHCSITELQSHAHYHGYKLWLYPSVSTISWLLHKNEAKLRLCAITRILYEHFQDVTGFYLIERRNLMTEECVSKETHGF